MHHTLVYILFVWPQGVTMTRQDARKVVKKLLQGKILVVSAAGRGAGEGVGRREKGRSREEKPCEQGCEEAAAGQDSGGEYLRGERGRGG